MILDPVHGVVEHDSARGHADDPIAIGSREFERVEVADDRHPVVAIDALQRIHDDPGILRIQ